MADQYIVHICGKNEWQQAQERGKYCPASLETEGFIHFSRPEQIARVAELFFKGRTDLVLLWVDPLRVNAEVRWEDVNGESFPHLYGALNLEAVEKVHPYLHKKE